jgi:hypothetical protein
MAEGRWVDRVVGLDGVRVEIAMLETADGHGRLEPVPCAAGARRRPAGTGQHTGTPPCRICRTRQALDERLHNVPVPG